MDFDLAIGVANNIENRLEVSAHRVLFLIRHKDSVKPGRGNVIF